MKKFAIKNLAFFLFFASVFAAQAQESVPNGRCGTINAADRTLIGEHLFENQQAIANGLTYERNAIKYIPIKFHIVAKSDSSGRISGARVLDLLCSFNANYLDQDIQFYIKNGFNYINDDNAYESPLEFSGENTLKINRDLGALNVFITNKIESVSSNGIVLGIYRPAVGSDYIIIIKSEVRTGAATLCHESGHFFSLLHTFNGWDCEPYDVNLHGTQVTTLAPCGGVAGPGLFNNNLVNVKAECMNGTEGSIRGDYVADTPADYNFGSGQSGCAAFNKIVKDPCGDTVKPQNNNFMSYFSNCATYQFTNGQKNLILASYLSNKRNYIRPANPNPAPNLSVINTSPVLISPLNNAVTTTYDLITFTWEAVAGADSYFIEISKLSEFPESAFTYRLFSSTNTVQLKRNLNPNAKYFWRVRPYNNLSTCQGFSNYVTNKAFFVTGTASANSDLGANVTINILSNPVETGEKIIVQTETKNTLRGDIALCSVTGQVLQNIREVEFAAGTSSVELNADYLSAGIYIVHFRSKDGTVWNGKVLVK